MSIVGFNSGMSDALQKIMEQRLKAQQQEFDTNLKLKEESRKAAEHSADLEFKREQLAQLKQAKADMAAEKLQKNLGPGKDTTAAQDKQLSDAGLPVSGGISLPSTSSQFGTLSTTPAAPAPDAAPPADAVGGNMAALDAPEGAIVDVQAPQGPQLGKITTQYRPPQDQRQVAIGGPRIPTQSVGSAADVEAKAKRDAVKALGAADPDTTDEALFGQLVAAGIDPDKAASTVKALRPPKGANASATALLNPATKNAVVFNADGPNGAGYYDVATHAFVPAPAARPTGDPALAAINAEIAGLRRDNLKEGNEEYIIKPGSIEDKEANQLASGDIKLSDFYAIFGRAAGASARRREAVLQAAFERNPAFSPTDYQQGFEFSRNPKVVQQVSSLNNVASSIPDLLKVSDEATRSNVPLLNEFVNKAGYTLGGKTYASLAVARQAFADELSGALGYGSATDMSRQMGKDMTDPNLSPDAFRNIMERTILPFIARKRANLMGPMGPFTKNLKADENTEAALKAAGSGGALKTQTAAPTAVPSNVVITRTN